MARPSKLTPKQWNEIEKRILGGEAVRKLAREYGISDTAINKRLSLQTKPVKKVANQLAAAELAMESLPVCLQVKVRTLADEMKDISTHLAGAARFGAMTSHKMAIIANAEAEKVDVEAPDKSIQQTENIARYTALANEAAKTGLNLLAANKGTSLAPVPDYPVRTLGDFYNEQDIPER
jgi:hypothetical protein